MKSISDFPNLTLRISREALPPIRPGEYSRRFRYFVRCDEIPGCCAHGSDIGEALDAFQEMSELWSSWLENTPSRG